MDQWQIIQSQTLVQNDWIALRQDTCRLPDGRIVPDYHVVVELDVACVVALTADQRLLICEQYKHAIQTVTFEIPGGLVSSADADPMEEARRELLEETGYDAPAFYRVGTLPISPARLSHHMHVFAAVQAYQVSGQQLDDNEEIRVHALPLAEVKAMMWDGRITASTSVAGIYLGLDHLRRLGLLSGDNCW
jgi:8-oxo-dGTP pyrophosphatase MutT (NUDIX family)